MLCNKCNTNIPDNFIYCPVCGAYTSEQQTQNTNFDSAAQYMNMHNTKNSNDETVSVGMWLGIFLINLIPCIGFIIYIILMFVWAFGNNTNKTLKNFAKAQLIILLVFICIFILATIFLSLTSWNIFRQPDLFDGYRYYYIN